MSARKLSPGQRDVLHVVVATPLGEGGHGGIDRIVDEVRHQVARVRPENLHVCYLATRGRGHIMFSPFFFAHSVLQLIGRWVMGRVDLLHINLSSHGSTLRKVLICRIARLLRIPYVIHLHGSRFRQFYRDVGPFGVREIDTMFRGASRVVVLGSVWKAFVSDRLPDVTPRIDVLPNATRAPAVLDGHPQGPVTVLFLGRIGSRKGVPQLVEAFERLADVPGWVGILAGDGEVEETRADVVARGIDDRVTVSGWMGPADVDRLLHSADILVLPSFDENLPMSVIEAMGCGLAVVTTPVGAVTDIIEDGVTGLLVPPGDSAELASALGRLIADPDLRAELGRKARAFHSQHLHIDSYLPRLVSIWHSAIANEAGHTVRQAV